MAFPKQWGGGMEREGKEKKKSKIYATEDPPPPAVMHLGIPCVCVFAAPLYNAIQRRRQIPGNIPSVAVRRTREEREGRKMR